MAFDPGPHGTLEAYEAMSLTHPFLQRYCEQVASPDGHLMSQASWLHT